MEEAAGSEGDPAPAEVVVGVEDEGDGELMSAEELKARGNEFFQAGRYGARALHG